MKQRIIFRIWMCLWGALCFFSCSSHDEQVQGTDKISICINSSIEQTLSRSVIPYPEDTYKGKYYVYEVGGKYVSGGNLTSQLRIENMDPAKQYKVVLLAVPQFQYDITSTEGTESIPSYNGAKTRFQGEESQWNYEIFRDILTITPSITNMDYDAVLTRQNGAVEIRIRNMQLQEVTLQVNGTEYMYFHDGTGGQVLSDNPLSLKRMLTSEQLTSSETRIRINLLPQEDITAKDGTETADNKLIIKDKTGVTTYPLKSSEGSIPIYSNQVTWLTLGNGDDSEGNFTVDFSGDGSIRLEDDVWDGWQNY